ncbi:MAG: hypothetical protein JOZ31_27305 [Verrucomicrobia bacterium]|nr:hypothetical protein [Verrucomicrobiota bacterium]
MNDARRNLLTCNTDEVRDLLDAGGYALHWTADEKHLELFEISGGYFAARPILRS